MPRLALQRDCGLWRPPEAGHGPQPDSDGPGAQGECSRPGSLASALCLLDIWPPGTVCVWLLVRGTTGS